MSIDLSKIIKMSDSRGVIAKIESSSGHVIWSSTITFTLNGETFIADKGMTWSEWFASDYNTAGITEGTVTDASGNEIPIDAVIVGGTAYEVGVGPYEATVTINASGTGVGMGCYLTIDGVMYGTAIATDSYVFPVGTVISCFAKTDSDDMSGANPDYGYHSSYGNIIINGEYVAYATNGDYEVTYDYIVKEKAYIELHNNKGRGRVEITEIPEGYALVDITGAGFNNVYKACVLTIDGTEYASATKLVVPIGTVITCNIASEASGEEGYVKVNGTTVLSVPSGQGTYDYTVTGNVTINMSTVRNADKDRTGYITITEL